MSKNSHKTFTNIDINLKKGTYIQKRNNFLRIIYCTLKNENFKIFQKLLYVEIHKNMTKILVKFYYMTQNITSDF